MKKTTDKYLTQYVTDANKDQTEYFVAEMIHGISDVRLDGKSVEYEVILRLKEKPKDYVNLDVFVRRDKEIYRKKL